MFRFTIRELVLLTLVVAMGVGWFIDHRAQAWNQHVSDSKLHLVVGKLNELGWTLKAYASGREFSVERLHRPKPEP